MTPGVPGLQFPLLPTTALVVEPNSSDMGLITSALNSAGFTVIGMDNFKEAGTRIIEAPPGMLVTEIRLGAYNGLQLAYRGKSVWPPMPIVLTSAYRDPVLERDVARIGATFVLKPVTVQEFVAAIYRTALRQPNSDGMFEPVQPPFERRLTERRHSPVGDSAHAERRRIERRHLVLLTNRLAKT
jgi:DNA-binding NtrC family response regulator